jgi:hypothetical protein
MGTWRPEASERLRATARMNKPFNRVTPLLFLVDPLNAVSYQLESAYILYAVIKAHAYHDSINLLSGCSHSQGATFRHHLPRCWPACPERTTSPTRLLFVGANSFSICNFSYLVHIVPCNVIILISHYQILVDGVCAY